MTQLESSAEKGRVLVVDDNPANLKLVRLLLIDEGYEVQTALDAARARELVSAWRPGLILLDVHLPVVDGLTLARELKADPATRSIAIVALTALASSAVSERARQAGCDGYLPKPIDLDALCDLVAKHLAGELGS